MKVVGHDGERANTPDAPRGGSTQVDHQPIAVDVIAHDVLTAVAAGHNVVDRIWVLEPQASWHALQIDVRAAASQDET
jgi:hypothetical protein